MAKAVILLSGGLDSATCVAIAKSQGFECYALSFMYGQKHTAELEAAKRIADQFEVAEHRIVNLDVGQFGGSALTDKAIDVPEYSAKSEIPVTYVPARNTVFLSIALGYAEVLQANDLFIGANVVDYGGYPDCRPEFLAAFQAMARLATKAGVEGAPITINAPLLTLTKAEIIATGRRLGVDYAMTVSCYQAGPGGEACGKCHSCEYRRKGFAEAGCADPTIYF
ncbi:7-cyano-7-deazaguanine synthase QueC [Legionella dresdenensis]|uniref:7-cyano-7-deazaguanine synthase n=1 Tax=Legionella dresdenensis TaxID=450200 RepID=A0ABV8CDH7_9GAMM